MQHFYQNIDGWFSCPNFYKMQVQQFNNAVFVEVGSWQGQSSCFMAVEILNSSKNIDFYCVDTWEGSAEHQNKEIIKSGQLYSKFLENIEPVKQVIKPMRMSSVDAAREFKDESVDFVYLDGSHDYESVRSDIYAWYPKLKKGGLMSGDDCTWPGVVKAVNEFVTTSCHTLHILGFEDVWGFIKRGRLLPEPSPEMAKVAIDAIGKL